MQQNSGQGTCVGNVMRSKERLCGLQVPVKKTFKWIIPHEGGWWVCSKTGLTPCISVSILKESKDFCVQITVIPRILYYPREIVFQHWNLESHRVQKREPLTALTLAMILSVSTAGAATGITSLVQQNKGLTSLRAAVED